jgi:hypothetical protein
VTPRKAIASAMANTFSVVLIERTPDPGAECNVGYREWRATASKILHGTGGSVGYATGVAEVRSSTREQGARNIHVLRQPRSFNETETASSTSLPSVEASLSWSGGL